jgi:translation initiation factor 3 subunit I
MRPILLQGHERSLTQVKYSKDGDLIFSTAKDQVICAWFSANGERLGTYHGHQGAVWSVDVDSTTTMLVSGAADNTIRLWDIRTGKCLKVWDFPTAVKRVEFSEDGTKLLGVTEKRMGHLATIVVFDVVIDVEAEQTDEPALTITCEEAKATVAGWSYLNKYIIAGHEDGSVSQYDADVSTKSQLTLSATKFFTDRRTTHSRAYSPRLDHGPSMVFRPNVFHYRFSGQNRKDHLYPGSLTSQNLR